LTEILLYLWASNQKAETSVAISNQKLNLRLKIGERFEGTKRGKRGDNIKICREFLYPWMGGLKGKIALYTINLRKLEAVFSLI
jgi:hypothetical protein